MKKRKLLVGIAMLTFVLAFVTAAYAAPITLFTDRITKLKFVNYETAYDNDGDTFLSVGDKIEGILNVESITDISGFLEADPLLGKELTGHFQFTIVGTTGGPLPITPFPAASGHLDFALQTDDFFRLYVDDFSSGGDPWNPDNSDGKARDRATDGSLWVDILPGTFYEGINDTTILPVAFSLNQNWANITTNNTGYPIQPLLYPEVIPGAPVHTYMGALHPTGHVVDTFFSSHLTTNLPIPPGIDGWLYRSEDPVYINAVPEPATMLLLGTGLIGLAGAARRRKKK